MSGAHGVEFSIRDHFKQSLDGRAIRVSVAKRQTTIKSSRRGSFLSVKGSQEVWTKEHMYLPDAAATKLRVNDGVARGKILPRGGAAVVELRREERET
ncbi:hypothetical protein WN943_010160 [Citrus x changshan-huyou]